MSGSLILGIGGFDHDGAVSLIREGEILGHVEWERICRERFAGLRSGTAVRLLLQATGWPLDEVRALAWADHERFADPAWADVRSCLVERFPGVPLTALEHHLCHQASAYLPSGWGRAALLSVDGKGDGASGAIGIGEGGAIQVLARQPSASSVGRTWHALAITCGYPHFGAAGKVMALAAYGSPRYLEDLLGWTRFYADGTFSFTAPGEAENQGPTFRRADRQAAFFGGIFGLAPLIGGALLSAQHADLAASVQAWTDRVVGHMAAAAVRSAGTGRLCLAGGVGLNVLTNRHLLESGIVKELFVLPAAGDSGLSLGAALALSGRQMRHESGQRFSPYLGRACQDEDVQLALTSYPHLRAVTPRDPVERAAACLAAGEMIGWVHGRAEAGPRALGARSLLASPLVPGQRDRINRIKGREAYRPVALAVLSSYAHEAFVGPTCPYMLRAAQVVPALRDRLGEGVHRDGSSRLQVVDEQGPPALARLLRGFEAQTGVPALINTSLNAKGEPLADSAADALALLDAGRIDRLFIEGLEVCR